MLLTLLQEKDWQQVLLQVKDTVSKTVVQKVAKQKFYWGELKQIHGYEEASKFVKMGKFREVKDRDILFINNI